MPRNAKPNASRTVQLVGFVESLSYLDGERVSLYGE